MAELQRIRNEHGRSGLYLFDTLSSQNDKSLKISPEKYKIKKKKKQIKKARPSLKDSLFSKTAQKLFIAVTEKPTGPKGTYERERSTSRASAFHVT